MQVFPFFTVQKGFHSGVIWRDAPHHDLGTFAVYGKPRLCWLQTQPGDSWRKFADDELEIFLIVSLLDVPTHDNFDLHENPFEAALVLAISECIPGRLFVFAPVKWICLPSADFLAGYG